MAKVLNQCETFEKPNHYQEEAWFRLIGWKLPSDIKGNIFITGKEGIFFPNNSNDYNDSTRGKSVIFTNNGQGNILEGGSIIIVPDSNMKIRLSGSGDKLLPIDSFVLYVRGESKLSLR